MIADQLAVEVEDNYIYMTIEEVIKALEICADTSKSCCTEVCPYYKRNTSCLSIELKRDALELIKTYKRHLENDIEEKRKEIEIQRMQIVTAMMIAGIHNGR